MTKPCFEVFRDKKGHYRFRLCAGNRQTILSSQGYRSRAAALNGIKAAKRNAKNRERFELRKSGSGKPYFVLKAANNEVIGQSQMYATASSRSGGMRSVMACAGSARVHEAG